MLLEKIIKETASVVGKNKLALLKVIILPAIVMLLLEYLSFSITETYQVILYKVADSIIWALFAISVHRVVLIGKESVGQLGNIRLKSREIMYIAYGILIGLLIVPIVIIFGFIPVIGIFIALVGASIVLSRLSILLPAIAVDREFGISKAWNVTSGYTWTCLASIVIIPVILALPILLLAEGQGMVTLVLSVVYSMVIMVISVALLSTTYKHLVVDSVTHEEIDT